MNETSESTLERRVFEIAGVMLIILGVLAECSFFTNTGVVGNGIAYMLKLVFGQGKYAVPLLVVFWGLTIAYRSQVKLKPNSRFIGLMVLFLTLLAFFHLQAEHPYEFEYAFQGRGGGLIGGFLLYWLRKGVAEIGSYIVLGGMTLIGVLLVTDIFLAHLLEGVKDKSKSSLAGVKNLKNKMGDKQKADKRSVQQEKKDNPGRIGRIWLWIKEKLPLLGEDDKAETDDNSPAAAEGADSPEQSLQQSAASQSPRKKEVADDDSSTENEEESTSQTPNQQRLITDTEQSEPDDYQQQQLFAEAQESEKYKLPALSLLNDAGGQEASFVNKTEILEETLENFGVEAEITDVNHGPTITRYEIQPAPGVKVSKIVNLGDDIALSMAASDVRIEAPIPGKSAVGIEIPNEEQVLVTLREVLDSSEFKTEDSKLTLGLGKDIAGQPVVADLAEMPHMLVAGATGSGKSVFINSIINSILQKATPEEVKFLLVDPKMVELTAYKGIPHLVSPVVTDAKKAATALRWVVKEMENRYELFADTGSKGIDSYNRKHEEDPLPYIVVIIDELADLMMVAAKEVEDAICRLAQKARAAGIHMILATQRPSVDVVTGVIKANIPNRVSFALSSQADSRTILDMGGAEKLLGQGDMLYAPVDSNQPVRVQGAFISEAEIKRVVDFVKQQEEPEFADKIADIKDNSVDVELDDEKDELYEKAVKLVVNNRASISFLQRRLSIGYNRAARMIDKMEEENIVGPHRGSKAREVLIDPEELEQILDN